MNEYVRGRDTDFVEICEAKLLPKNSSDVFIQAFIDKCADKNIYAESTLSEIKKGISCFVKGLVNVNNELHDKYKYPDYPIEPKLFFDYFDDTETFKMDENYNITQNIFNEADKAWDILKNVLIIELQIESGNVENLGKKFKEAYK